MSNLFTWNTKTEFHLQSKHKRHLPSQSEVPMRMLSVTALLTSPCISSSLHRTHVLVAKNCIQLYCTSVQRHLHTPCKTCEQATLNGRTCCSW